jgi:hypothetical protein
VHDSLGKDKGYHVSQMHAIAAGSPTSIQEERFTLFISVQYDVELSMNRYTISTPSRQHPARYAPVREKHPATKKNVWSMPREALKALQHCIIHSSCAELVDKLVIIDSELLPITRDGALYGPGCHNLLVRCRRICRLDRADRHRSRSPTGLEPRSSDEDRKKTV